jgi:intracellular multiplication protein IcmV
MKKKSRIVNLFSRIINIRRWFDWERMKAYTLYLGNGVSRLFVPQKQIQEESFDHAVKEFNLDDKNLLLKQKSLFRLSIIMVFLAFLILIYAGYQLFYGAIIAFIISLVVMMIALVLAFRYHFWYYQIKNRKLGCTFSEWYRQGLLGGKK